MTKLEELKAEHRDLLIGIEMCDEGDRLVELAAQIADVELRAREWALILSGGTTHFDACDERGKSFIDGWNACRDFMGR